MKSSAYAVCLFVPLIAVAAMNRYVDVGGFGAADTVQHLAAEQKPGEYVVAATQIELRTWVKARLLKNGECPDVLVVGSSTVGHIANGMFPGLTSMNAYLQGPTVEDFEALTSILRRTTCRPRALVIGADPWWIGNPQVDERRWTALVDDYLDYNADFPFYEKLGIRAQVAWTHVEEELNFSTTRESASVLLARRGGHDLGPHIWHGGIDAFCASNEVVPNIVAVDGHYLTCPSQLMSDAERETTATTYLQRNMHSMGEWRDVAYDRIDRIGRVLKEWSRDISPVVVVGMPYHPTTYQQIRANERVSRNLTETDRRLAAMGTSRIQFLSFRDPATVPCSSNEFEDSHHANPVCVGRVAAKIASEARALSAR